MAVGGARNTILAVDLSSSHAYIEARQVKLKIRAVQSQRQQNHKVELQRI